MSLGSVDLARVGEELDLERRIRDVPESAAVRGVFFTLLHEYLGRANVVDGATVLRLIGPRRRSYALCPVRDYLRAYAIGGALVDASAAEGIRKIFRDSPAYYTATWFGAAFRRLIEPNPMVALSWIERSRDHLANYGYWRLERRGAEHAIVHMYDEYSWIETMQLGGCEGLLAACGVLGEVRAELDSRFRGRLHIRWQKPN